MRILTPQWTNRSLASDLMTEMDQFFNDWTPTKRSEFYDERSFNPACEISETEEHFMMSVDLPGMKKSDIKIEVADDILTVSGERKRESNTDKKSKVHTAKPRQIEVQSGKSGIFDRLLGSKKNNQDVKDVSTEPV